MASAEINGQFDWETHPELEAFINENVEFFLSHNKFAKELSKRMMDETSTRFIDWIDHMALPEERVNEQVLKNLGLAELNKVDRPEGFRVFKHPRSYLFPILLSSEKDTVVALKPECIDDFLQALALGIVPEGEPFSLREGLF